MRPSELPDLPKMQMVALDTETDGLFSDDGARVSVVSLAWVSGVAGVAGEGEGWGTVTAVAFPFAQGKDGKPDDDGVRSLFEPAVSNLPRAEWEALLRWLTGRRLVGANIKFDLDKMRAGTIGLHGQAGWPGIELDAEAVWDTMIASKELWPTLPAGLKPTAGRLWGHDQEAEAVALKGWLGPQTDPRYDRVPWDVMEPYAAKDAELTIRLWAYQQDRAAEGQLIVTGPAGVDREFDVMRALYRMERRGLPYAAAESLEAAGECEKRQRVLEDQMRVLGFSPTTGDARRWFFGGQAAGGLGLDPIRKTEKGVASVTAEVVAELQRRGVAGADLYARWTKLATAGKMWYAPYASRVGPDGRLRTCFRQVAGQRDHDGGTRSGRFSVERVNLQAMPHDYRLGDFEALAGIPTPRQLVASGVRGLAGGGAGWSLWELDLQQAELRVAALWAGCDRMLDTIRAGGDPHGATAKELFQIDEDSPRWGPLRQVAKRANFSLIFGSGWSTFQKMVHKEAGVRLADYEAEQIVGDWNRLYPQYSRAIDRESDRARRFGRVELANGRSRWFARGEDHHKAFNQKVQASLAEFGKEWLVATEWRWGAELDRRGRAAGLEPGAGLVLVIHDSQVLLLPDEQAGEVVRNVQASAVQIWDRMFPGTPGAADAKAW